MGTHRSHAPALVTPSLLATIATLHLELDEVIDRSRDLLWLGRQRRLGHDALVRDILGGSDGPIAEGWAAPQPKCPICREAIVSGEVVIFDHGDLYHIDCRQSLPIPRIPPRLATSRRAQRPSSP
jgi:hypothetical protein